MTVRNSSKSLLAFHSHLHLKDVRKYVFQRHGIVGGHHVHSSSSHIDRKMVVLNKKAPRLYRDFFYSWGFCRRFCLLYFTAHLLFHLLSSTITATNMRRTLTFVNRVLRSICLCSFFFQVSGSSTNISSPSECAASSIWDKVFQNFAIAVRSTLLVEFPVFLHRLSNTRFFVFRSDWNDGSKRKKLSTWQRQKRAVWLVGIAFPI